MHWKIVKISSILSDFHWFFVVSVGFQTLHPPPICHAFVTSLVVSQFITFVEPNSFIDSSSSPMEMMSHGFHGRLSQCCIIISVSLYRKLFLLLGKKERREFLTRAARVNDVRSRSARSEYMQLRSGSAVSPQGVRGAAPAKKFYFGPSYSQSGPI